MKTFRKTTRRQAAQFLSALFLPAELIELRFIESWVSDGKKRSRVVRAAQWLQRADVIAMYADLTAFAKQTRANVYFGVCPRPRRGDADDGSVETVRCVWCDIDDVTLEDAWSRWTYAEVPEPSIVVTSGSGVHAYWLLEQDLCFAIESSRLGAMLPHFYASFGGDHVQNLSRIMRLPGTLNYKDARNGRAPRPCNLDICDADLRYPLQAFSPWFEQAARNLVETKLAVSLPPSTVVSTDESSSRPTQIAELVCRLHEPTRDRSRRDFAIVCDLLRLGLAKEEIRSLVSSSSKFESAGRPYFDLTIANAERTVMLDGTVACRPQAAT